MTDKCAILKLDNNNYQNVVNLDVPLQYYEGFEVDYIDIATIAELYKILCGLSGYTRHINEYDFLSHSELTKSALFLIPNDLTNALANVKSSEIENLAIIWCQSLEINFHGWSQETYLYNLNELCKLSFTLKDRSHLVILFRGNAFYGKEML